MPLRGTICTMDRDLRGGVDSGSRYTLLTQESPQRSIDTITNHLL